MIRTVTTLALAAGLAAAPALPALAGEDVDHYAAETPETLGEAVASFSEYNERLSGVLAKDELSTADLERIHELTYTLEEALAMINERMGALPATLERLHKASEAHDVAASREAGAAYLEVGGTVIP